MKSDFWNKFWSSWAYKYIVTNCSSKLISYFIRKYPKEWQMRDFCGSVYMWFSLPAYVLDPQYQPECPRWDVTWQNQQSDCAPSEDSDQPGHPSSLIRVLAVRMKKACVLRYPLSAQRRLWSESLLDAQSLCWFCHVAAQIVLFKVDEKAAIRNRYNRISHPALDTKWERSR